MVVVVVVVVLHCSVGLSMEVKEPAKLLVQSITTDSALPAIDWSAVLCPLLSSNNCGQFLIVIVCAV